MGFGKAPLYGFIERRLLIRSASEHVKDLLLLRVISLVSKDCDSIRRRKRESFSVDLTNVFTYFIFL